MKPLGVIAPPPQADGPLHGAAWGTRGLTVLLARNSDAKARILSSWQQGLSAPLRPNASNGAGAMHTQALIIDAHDLRGAAGFADTELSACLAVAGSPERAARQAIATLRARAATLLEDDGSGGRIAQLTARLRGSDLLIRAAQDAEAAERERIEPLLAAAAVIVDLERARDEVLNERARWSLLIRLWPEWQCLERARRDLDCLATFDHFPADIDQRLAAYERRAERAERTLLSAQREMRRLLSERDELTEREVLPPGAAREVPRLCADLPVYRSRLLELAAARARLDDCQRASAADLARLGREDAARLAEVDLSSAHRTELQRWQERSRHVQIAHAEAESAVTAASARVRDLCTQVSEQLAGATAEGEDEVDARWGALWKLRTQLEDIWNVQSRAESNARALAEREEAVRRDGGRRYWAPPPWLQSAFTTLAVLATAAWGSGALRGRVPALAVAGLAVLFIVLRVVLQVRARWVQVLEEGRGARAARLRHDIETLRRRRDAGWARAAKLGESIRAAAAILALPETVTPEAVESCELELAGQLRTDGPRTHLTALLLDLLNAQDDESRTAAQLAGAGAARRALEREWAAWCKDTGFTHEIAIDRVEGWLQELDQLAASRAALDAARGQLQAIEPVTAAWEADARHLLQQAGVTVRPELCGSALAAEINTLAARAQGEAERRTRRARVEAEIDEADRLVVGAEAELALVRAARQELLSATGAADEAALRAQMDGWRRWREARDRVRRLQMAIDDALDGLLAADAVRAQLARGEGESWDAELERSAARLEDIHSRLEGAAQRQLAAEQCLEAARAATEVSDLQLEREAVLAELTESAREWKLRVLAAALLEVSVQEHERTGRRQWLEAASRTLSALSKGRYTAIARSDHHAAGLALVDCDGRRVPVANDLSESVRSQVQVSLLLGRAAQLASRGTPLPVVLDDVLCTLPTDDAQLVAQEILSLARAHSVFYVTTAAQRFQTLSALPADVSVVDVD
jgi:uncharacterized protein YhaN